MIPAKIVKRAAWVCAGLLAASLALLAALQYAPALGGQPIGATGSAVFYDGSADFGVVLVSPSGPDRAALLALLRESYSAPVLLCEAPDTVDFSAPLPYVLAQSANLPPERILTISVGDTALPVIGTSPTLGRVLLRPGLALSAETANQSHAPLLLLGQADEPAGRTEAAVLLYNGLSGDDISFNGRPLRAQRGGVALHLTPSAVLSDAAPSQALLDALSDWISQTTGAPVVHSRFPSIQTFLWLVAALSLLVLALLLALLCRASYDGPTGVVTAEVNRRWLFFAGRAVLWLAALPVMGLGYLACSLLDVPLGTAGRLFVSYAAGCALGTGALYRLGMLGVDGNPSDIKAQFLSRGLLQAAGLLLAVLLSGGLLTITGFWGVELTLSRGFLFAALWAVFSVGFLFVMHDALLLAQTARTEEMGVALLLMPYLPLAALAVLCVPMGLLPVGVALLKLTGALAVSILLAKVVRELTGGALLAAVVGALPFSLLAALQTYL